MTNLGCLSIRKRQNKNLSSKAKALSAPSSSSSSRPSGGKVVKKPASPFTLVEPDSEDHPEHPESQPLERKRQNKDLTSKAYHGGGDCLLRRTCNWMPRTRILDKFLKGSHLALHNDRQRVTNIITSKRFQDEIEELCFLICICRGKQQL